MLKLFVILVLFQAVFAYKSYDGYTAYHILLTEQRDVDFVHDLTQSPVHYNIWKETKNYIDVMVKPENVQFFTYMLDAYGLEYSTLMEDVGDVITGQMARYTTKSSKKAFDYEVYHTLDEIHAWIDEIAANYSSIVTTFSVGDSYEGRPIRGLRISTGAGRPAAWIDSCIHAREWIAAASTIYFVGKLLENYGTDPIVTDILDNVDLYHLPVFNVDGYEFSWSDDRMWRKTRSPNAGSTCVGTDPNRNWDYFWGEFGTSTNPCSDSYGGPNTLSEIEVIHVNNYLETIPNLELYMAFHSHGEWYMTPYAQRSDPPSNHDQTMVVCNAAIAALENVPGSLNFDCGTIASFVGLTSGSSVDWVLDTLGTTYNFAPELRGPSFILDEDQIVPSGEENYAAIVEILAAVRDLP